METHKPFLNMRHNMDSQQLIKICLIKRDQDLQQRTDLFNVPTVNKYSELITDGVEFPPITLFKDSQSNYWLADGFQRTEAHKAAGKAEILAIVKPGEKRDAILFSASSNSQHGLPMKSEDKRRAVKVLLQDVEWCSWSDRTIARHVGVSNRFVGTVRHDLELAGDIKPTTERKMIRGGAEVTIKTNNIGECERTQSNECEYSQLDEMTERMLSRLLIQVGGKKNLLTILGEVE